MNRCELLSKIIIFVTRHNTTKGINEQNTVVNCFQKLLSSWHDTTIQPMSKTLLLLWIAFKNYYLRDTTQRQQLPTPQQHRCELLSKIIIFVTRHNQRKRKQFIYTVVNCFQKLLSSWHDTTTFVSVNAQFFVVNCFQKLLSSWHDTTNLDICCVGSLLWIAFKNYYLRDTTQQSNYTISGNTGCELLSKIIIFVTRHNNYKSNVRIYNVVNCFQKLLSSWHDTTSNGFI